MARGLRRNRDAYGDVPRRYTSKGGLCTYEEEICFNKIFPLDLFLDGGRMGKYVRSGDVLFWGLLNCVFSSNLGTIILRKTIHF